MAFQCIYLFYVRGPKAHSKLSTKQTGRKQRQLSLMVVQIKTLRILEELKPELMSGEH